MNIEDLFERDIHRSINGVVKADQLDDDSVWQELDEFVVTRELTKHIYDLVAVLLLSIEQEENAAGNNGVWVSGFFGCGKSHFIKVLSYLLENKEHHHNGENRRAVDFFSEKLTDSMLFADLKKVVAATTEPILFNIDSKADLRSGRDTLLQVFLKVLNEKQGYSGDHPHIAHLERYLDEKGKLESFQQAYEREAGETWLAERDAWEFHRDEVVAALVSTLEQSEASVEKWVDGGSDHFSLTVENFARWVKRYLDSKGPAHRIMFLVDEVGQFIGNDTHLMLNLQTITEQLGTVCRGQAWVVVTSQEDLDAVLGDLNQSKQQDFSKIQGRFKTRLSLSSANVDEVIKKRLLAKKATATAPLIGAYQGKQDILKNQLSFVKAGMTFKTYVDEQDFVACYPFPAYQFALVQKIFESIRKAGATGLHLSQGERSTLDAFQSAAKQIGSDQIGTLVPLYRFYPAVEGFLDTSVKRTIDQAHDNHALKSFDAILLQVLFLIRYVDELPGSVDNLVTLCIDQIDSDKLALRKAIEASLSRLEAETLIARNGDLYFFLTNEERDIGREIKTVTIASGAEERELGKLLFVELLNEVNKHHYSLTQKDFSFTRFCDDQPVGNRIDGSLEVAFCSPLGDRYAELSDDTACCQYTFSEHKRLLIRLPDDPNLARELRTYLQIESYVKTKHTGSLPDTTKRILHDRSDDNRSRKARILADLKAMLSNASYFACGQQLTIKHGDPKAALDDALEYLIKNTYAKMRYIQHLNPNPLQEIQSLLRANDIDTVGLNTNTPAANSKALDDLREYIRLCEQTSTEIVLHELINKRYGGIPYGWPALEVLLLVVQLAVRKEIKFGGVLEQVPLERAYDAITSSRKQRKVTIKRQEVAAGDLLKKAQSLGKELFAQQGPGTEEPLYKFLKDQLISWADDLKEYQPLAQTGQFPGKDQIEDCLQCLRLFLEESESLRFLQRFVGQREELLQCADDMQELQGFYTHQRPSWEALRKAVTALSQNRLQLAADSTAGPALARMEEILSTERPYPLLHEVANLQHAAQAVNEQLLSTVRGSAANKIQHLLDGVTGELDKLAAEAALRNKATDELMKLHYTATKITSIAHITEAIQTADMAYDRALNAIDQAQLSAPGKPEDPLVPQASRKKVKKRRIVQVSELCSGNFIENSADIEMFLKKLRSRLEAAIEADERVQIK